MVKHSNNSIVWACLNILWAWRLKGYQTILKITSAWHKPSFECFLEAAITQILVKSQERHQKAEVKMIYKLDIFLQK